jgi:hypothetical protein
MSLRNRAAAKSISARDIVVPDKLYFRIGEVSSLCRLPAYVLRFWESEFPQLKPVKSSTGQRMYRRKDVDSVLRIKQLLYEVKGAKKQPPLPFPAPAGVDLKPIRQGLNEILTLLSARR